MFRVFMGRLVMKFNCGPTWAEKKEAKEQWHPWFAWHPVRIGSGDCRWLETIERKGEYYIGGGGYLYMYRARVKQTEETL